ncbi:MAG: sensor histidine kinase [Acidimicrobiales bacterium]
MLASHPASIDPQPAERWAATQRELAERVAALEHANVELWRSNAKLAEFASIAAHDLRAPLQTMTGYAELLADHAAASLDPESIEYLDAIRRGATRLQSLVEGLLAYARVGTTIRRREEVACQQLMDDACDALAARIAEMNATLRYRSLPAVVGDPTELAQVFQNLVGNALKFTRPGIAPVVEVTAHRAGEEWRFEVADNGIGIEARHRERIFRVFQRLQAQGAEASTGIGLAMCKRIVEGHGGRIWAEDNPGAGARLCFTIPAPVCWSPF